MCIYARFQFRSEFLLVYYLVTLLANLKTNCMLLVSFYLIKYEKRVDVNILSAKEKETTSSFGIERYHGTIKMNRAQFSNMHQT